MVTPRNVAYTGTPGATLYVGQSSLLPPVDNRLVLVGDSLTDTLYGQLHTATWLNARAGGVLKNVINLGVSGNTVAQALARIDNNYLDASPGMAGLGTVGWAVLRIGTNNTRGGGLIQQTTKDEYTALIAKIRSYASRLIVLAVPPIGAPESGAGVNSFNSWLASYCPTVPGVHFINDCTGVNNGSGDWVAGYAPPDGIHFGGKAAQRMAADGAAAFKAIVDPFSYASPLSTDSADKYPAQPQWVTNHVMAGSGGSNSIGSGATPTGWAVSSYGTGFSATTQVVAADAGDANQTPWLRITPTAINSGASGWMQWAASMSGRAITDSDPVSLDIAVEYRFNGFDASRFSQLRVFVYGASNENMGGMAKLQMGDAQLDGTVVARIASPRTSGKKAHASAKLQFELVPTQTFSGAMGSIDVRCGTVRG